MDTRKLTKVAAIPIGLLVSGLLVGQASSAAFTAQTSTGANTFATSSIQLTNDHLATSVFAVGDMIPGATGTKAVKVSYTGAVPVTVKMYAAAGDTITPLAAKLQIKVNDGNADIYDGSLAGFSAKTTFAAGAGSWAPTATADRSYQITWTLPADATDALQGTSTQVTFVWEAQTS